jgi:ribosomal protein L37AE/L43A
MRRSSVASRPGHLVCPLCEADQLHPSDRTTLRCETCGGHLSGAMLETLRCISTLPDTLGSHPCEECGHPEMRRLPDGTFHCPACGSEVLPVDATLGYLERPMGVATPVNELVARHDDDRPRGHLDGKDHVIKKGGA